MTEQEIINVLKENKTKGVAYMFLPEDVWNWIGENFNNPRLMYLAPNGQWRLFSETDFDDYDNVAFTLPDDYELPQKPSGEWEEFTITDGAFTAEIECDEGESYIEDFHWWDWQDFLRKSFDYDMNYTSFGGWQYDSENSWFTCPQIFCERDAVLHGIYEDDDKPRSAIPKKIRFWRENNCGE